MDICWKGYPRHLPAVVTREQSTKVAPTQSGPFKPTITKHHDRTLARASARSSQRVLRSIAQLSSASPLVMNPSVQSLVQSILSDMPSRSLSQRKALRSFTTELKNYVMNTRNVPKQDLITSPSATTVSVNTIKELKPYQDQFADAGLAVTSAEQRGIMNHSSASAHPHRSRIRYGRVARLMASRTHSIPSKGVQLVEIQGNCGQQHMGMAVRLQEPLSESSNDTVIKFAASNHGKPALRTQVPVTEDHGASSTPQQQHSTSHLLRRGNSVVVKPQHAQHECALPVLPAEVNRTINKAARATDSSPPVPPVRTSSIKLPRERETPPSYIYSSGRMTGSPNTRKLGSPEAINTEQSNSVLESPHKHDRYFPRATTLKLNRAVAEVSRLRGASHTLVTPLKVNRVITKANRLREMSSSTLRPDERGEIVQGIFPFYGQGGLQQTSIPQVPSTLQTGNRKSATTEIRTRTTTAKAEKNVPIPSSRQSSKICSDLPFPQGQFARISPPQSPERDSSIGVIPFNGGFVQTSTLAQKSRIKRPLPWLQRSVIADFHTSEASSTDKEGTRTFCYIEASKSPQEQNSKIVRSEIEKSRMIEAGGDSTAPEQDIDHVCSRHPFRCDQCHPSSPITLPKQLPSSPPITPIKSNYVESAALVAADDTIPRIQSITTRYSSPAPEIPPRSPARMNSVSSYDRQVMRGLHVATAAAKDEDLDRWIKKVTGMEVRSWLAALGGIEGHANV